MRIPMLLRKINRKLAKLIPVFVLVLGFFVFKDVLAANYWVTNPADCPSTNQTYYPGQNCDNLDICGTLSGNVAQCYDTSGIVTPSATGTSETIYTGSLPSGYILDCFATDSSVNGGYCSNNGDWWCNASSTCSDLNRETDCTANQAGVATCGGCSADAHACDGSFVDADGCEIQDGATCVSSDGLIGVYDNCNGAEGFCKINANYFETGVNVRYATSSSLLWGTQYGSGNLMELSASNTPGGIFTITNDGRVGIGTSTLGANNMLTVGLDAGSQFIVSKTGVITNGSWQAGIIGLAYGGTGLDFSTSTGFLYLSNGTSTATTTIYIGNTDLAVANSGGSNLLSYVGNTITLDTAGNWMGTVEGIDLSAASSTWDATTNTVNAGASNWNTAYNIINASSTNWQNTYNTVNASSSSWTMAYNAITASSTYWDTAYSNRIISTSGNITFTSNTIGVTTGYNIPLTASTTNWNTAYNTVNLNTWLADADFAANGLMVRTAAGVYAARTATGTSDQIVVTNGDGVSGNPTFGLASAIYLGTNGKLGRDVDNLVDFSTDNQITWRTNGINQMILNSSGYLGIGTTTPSNALTVLSANGAQLRLAYDANNYAEFLVDSAGQFSISSNGFQATTLGTGDEAFRVDENGNVMIGTTTASNLFTIGATSSEQFLVNNIGQVVGGTWMGTVIDNAYIASSSDWITAYDTVTASSTYWDTAYSWGNHASANYIADTDFSSNGLMIRTADGTYTARTATGTANQIVVTNGDGVSGNPTFGLASSVYLGVSGLIGRDANNYIDFSIANQIGFKASGTTKMLLNSSGYLGIGTTTPSQMLTVGSNNNFTVSSSGFATSTGFYNSGEGIFARIPVGSNVGNGSLYINPLSYAAGSIVSWSAKAVWNAPSVSELASPAFADLDNDGDLDVLLGDRQGISYGYENTGTVSAPVWSPKPSWNAPIVTSEFPRPIFVDLDSDSDQDLLIGAADGISYGYENTGTVSAPVWSARSSWNAPDVGQYSAPASADLDNDGDWDLLIGEFSGASYGYMNIGTVSAPTWSAFSGWNMPDIGLWTEPAFADLDNDADQDLLIGESSGFSYAYENIGTVSAPTWSAKSSWDSPDNGSYSLPAFADLDNDGDQDLLLGDILGASYAYENTGSLGGTNNTLFGVAVGGQEKFRVNAVGDVFVSGGISLSGVINTSVNTGATEAALVINQTGLGKIVDFKDGGNSVFVIKDGGYVGIGTTTPSQMLTVGATSSAQFLVNNIGQVVGGTWMGNAITNTYIASSSTWNTTTATVNASSTSWAMAYDAITASSSSWTSAYDIITASSTNWENTYNTVSTNAWLADTDFAANGIMIRTANGTYTNRTATGTTNQIVVTNGDGVSGDPTFALNSSVYLGTSGLIGRDSDNYIDFSTDNQIGFKASGTVQMILDANGNLGIGTSTPQSKLTVYGDVLIEGDNRYLNFGTTTSALGYGIRDNSGTLEYKNIDGGWSNIGSGDGISSFTKKYMLTDGDWSNSSLTLPGNLGNSQMAVIGNYVYLFGGYNGSTYTNVIYRASTSNPTSWTDTGSTLPGNLTYSQMVVIGDYVYLFGGYNGSTYTNVIYRASTSNPTSWTDTGSTLPGNLAYSQSAVIGDYVYLFGGCNGSNCTNVISRASTSNPTNWTDTGSTLPGVLSRSQIAIIDDYAYFFGGHNGSIFTNIIYRTPITSSITVDPLTDPSLVNNWTWKYKANAAFGGGGSNLFTVNGSNTYLTSLTNNLGIGTTTPAYKLSVNGGLGENLFQVATSTNAGIFTINANGNVGIGTTTSGSLLTVNTASGGTNVDVVSGLVGARLRSNGVDLAAVGTYTNHPFQIMANGGAVISIATSGNVGINTSNPLSRLHLYEPTASAMQELRMDGNSGSIHRLAWDSGSKYLEYSQATGSITLANASASDFVITNLGKIGIGTTSPVNKLDIIGGNVRILNSVTSQSSLTIGNTSTGNAMTYYDAINGDTIGSDYGMVGQNNAGYMEYSIGASSPAPYHVFSGGNVGIGTTSPAYNLEVNGTFNATSIYSNGALLVPGSGSNWSVNGANIYRSSGNVGIGTSTPTALLSLEGSTPFLSINATTAGRAKLALLSNGLQKGLVALSGQFEGDSTTDMALIAESGQQLRFYTNGSASEVMTINTSGNVGIGTTNPDRKLDVETSGATFISVVGGATNNVGLLMGTSSADAMGRVQYDNGTNALSLWSNNNERLTINSSGNVGIGTTNPMAKLHSAGITPLLMSTSDLVWGTTGSVAQFEFGAVSGNTYTKLEAFINGGSSFGNLILNSGGGNVGVGTTNPGYKLDVNGSFNATSVYSNGVLLSPGTGSNWSVNGSDIYRSAGNVGIGTSSPQTKLEVWGEIRNSGVNPIIRALSSGTGAGQLFMQVVDGATPSGYIGTNIAGMPLVFSSGSNVEAMRILSNGNVGIGTSSPGQKLTVLGGDISLRADNDLTSAISMIAGTTEGYIYVNNAGSSKVALSAHSSYDSYFTDNLAIGAIDSGDAKLYVNGNVGIGTSTPGTTKLRVTQTTTNAWAGLFENTDAADSYGLTVRAGNDSADASFSVMNRTSASTYLHVRGDGNTGLWTASPGYVLDVQHATSKINSKNGYLTNGADYAEYFYTNDTDLASGETVCIDGTKNNTIERCVRGADNNVMGIVSTNPSIVGNGNGVERDNDPHYKIIGMLGQVPALVTNDNGAIRPGDSLTSASTTPGFLMRAEAGDSTVGVALESFDASAGRINVLISRRNKSLTVETVEEEVTKRIADMAIEDDVRLMISDSLASLNVDDQIKTTIANELNIFDSRLTLKFDAMSGQIINLEEKYLDHETRLAYLENNFVQASTTMAQMQKSIDILNEKTIDSVEIFDPYQNASTTVLIADIIASQEVRILDLQTAVTENTTNITGLESRVMSIEERMALLEENSATETSSTSDVLLESIPSDDSIFEIVVAKLSLFGIFISDKIIGVKNLIADMIDTREIKITQTEIETDNVIGGGMIPAGATSTVIVSNKIATSSKLFVTFRGDYGSRWWIGDLQNGSSTLVIAEPLAEDIYFDWWVIGVNPVIAPVTTVTEEIIPTVDVSNIVEEIVNTEISTTTEEIILTTDPLITEEVATTTSEELIILSETVATTTP